jgi:hypothetical protein
MKSYLSLIGKPSSRGAIYDDVGLASTQFAARAYEITSGDETPKTDFAQIPSYAGKHR